MLTIAQILLSVKPVTKFPLFQMGAISSIGPCKWTCHLHIAMHWDSWGLQLLYTQAHSIEVQLYRRYIGLMFVQHFGYGKWYTFKALLLSIILYHCWIKCPIGKAEKNHCLFPISPPSILYPYLPCFRMKSQWKGTTNPLLLNKGKPLVPAYHAIQMLTINLSSLIPSTVYHIII